MPEMGSFHDRDATAVAPSRRAPCGRHAARGRGTAFLLAAIAAAILAPPLRSETWRVTFDPSATRIGFTLDATAHTVTGALALRSGEIAFDPASGQASGEIAVDLARAATGNARRDRKMHDEVLETVAFPLATLQVRRVTGPFVATGSSSLTVEGTLGFHGSEHPLTLLAKVTARDGVVTAALDLPIPYVAWGLRDPSVLFLRVAKVVNVTIEAQGALTREPQAAPSSAP